MDLGAIFDNLFIFGRGCLEIDTFVMLIVAYINKARSFYGGC